MNVNLTCAETVYICCFVSQEMQDYILNRYQVSKEEFQSHLMTMTGHNMGSLPTDQAVRKALKAIVRIHEPCLKTADDLIQRLEEE